MIFFATVQNAQEIAKVIIETSSDAGENLLMGKNAPKAAYQFVFNRLTKNLINIIESVDEREEIPDEFIRKNS